MSTVCESHEWNTCLQPFEEENIVTDLYCNLFFKMGGGKCILHDLPSVLSTSKFLFLISSVKKLRGDWGRAAPVGTARKVLQLWCTGHVHTSV